MFSLDKIGVAATVVFGITDTVGDAVPVTSWEKYLQGGALTVVSVVLVIFALKVFPMLINKLTEQAKTFADAQKASAKEIAEAQKAQASAAEKLADAFNALAIRCAVSQAEQRHG